MFNLETLLMPMSYWFVVAFGFGVIIGSFLNVYIYRFHTGKSLSGHSHCLSCGVRLKWYDLFPIFSFLYLRARCRVCGCKITARYFWVELATGLLFALTLLITTDILLILLFWIIFSVLLVITVYDLYHFIIPDNLTITLTLLVALDIVYRYLFFSLTLESILWTVGAALGGVLFFLFLWLVSKGTWLGFGDVKLVFPLGVLVGPTFVFSFVVLSFWVGAIISLAIIGFARLNRGKVYLHLPGRDLTMKSAVPFAPFLVASSLIILFTNFNVLQLFSFSI